MVVDEGKNEARGDATEARTKHASGVPRPESAAIETQYHLLQSRPTSAFVTSTTHYALRERLLRHLTRRDHGQPESLSLRRRCTLVYPTCPKEVYHIRFQLIIV